MRVAAAAAVRVPSDGNSILNISCDGNRTNTFRGNTDCNVEDDLLNLERYKEISMAHG